MAVQGKSPVALCALCPLFLLVGLLLLSAEVCASDEVPRSYNYNLWLETVPSAPAYRLKQEINVATMQGVYNFGELADIHVGKERVYIVDRIGSQVIITDHEFNPISRITLLKNEENRILTEGGNQMRLTLPEGAFEAENGDLYVADSGYRDPKNGEARIVVFSETTDSRGNKFYYAKRIIKRPDNFVGRTQFIPSKLVVDDAYRIYAVVQGGSEGIVVLNADGSFSHYFGINRIWYSPIDYFWKNLASEEQLEQMALTFAPPFNSVDIDENGFIYATNSDVRSYDKVARFNPSGDNIIRRMGYLPPMGDVPDPLTGDESEIISVTVNDYGMYAILDRGKGRIFVYNFDGELLFVIGNQGLARGEFINPGNICWLNDDIIASDKKKGSILVYTPTEFGQLVIDATKAYYVGDWDAAGEKWLQALRYNANYDIAYVGYGKMLYMQDRYEEALKYFRLGNNRTYYSMAYKKYRSERLSENFGLFIAPLLILFGLVVFAEYRHHKRAGEQ
jgi:tetratricopeptide (TPR) repeat protein